MFMGHVLCDGGFVETPTSAIKEAPHRGEIVRISSTIGDHDLIVTPDQYVLAMSTRSPRSWAWRKAHTIKKDDWIGTEIPKTLMVIRSTPGAARGTALGHQRNALFAGVARPVIDNRLGPVLDADDARLDETHAWFRVTNVAIEPFLSFMMEAKHSTTAVVDNVSVLAFP